MRAAQPLILVLALVLALTGRAFAADLTCPPTLEVRSTPDAPGGWSPYPARDGHGFAGAFFYEGSRETVMAATPPPVPLAPSRVFRHTRFTSQFWEFIGPRTKNVVLVCRYGGTKAAIAIDLPRDVHRCEQAVATDRRGTPLDQGKEPPRFLCR